MRLVRLSICNFRCYSNETSVDFDDLTAFIGKNDIGKSTLLEALEIFFNNDTVKAEQGDLNIHCNAPHFTVTCEFSDLPASLTLDAGAQTDLSSEYLLTTTGTLKIKKVFTCTTKRVGVEIFVVANHPTAEGVGSLLELKERELQQRVKTKELEVPLKGNPGMRKALWNAEPDLKLQEREIPVSKEDGKRIWEEIEKHLPLFALFQSDRKSQDSDGEVQDPMNIAIRTALSEVQDEIDAIQEKVRQKAEEIAKDTHAVLARLDKELAQQLNPEFTPPTQTKWNGLFSINMSTDGIPLNKRGSGVRRLVLVSFFKAEAERKLKSATKRSVIYAIEEPETSQHPNNQRLLLDSLQAIAEEPNCQVILTTHSPGLAADLPKDAIRFIHRTETGSPCIEAGTPIFETVARALGVTPDSRVKVLFCVEGPTDVKAVKALSKALHIVDESIPDLYSDERVAFVVMGGGTLTHWVTERYLRALNRPEFHIYDSDVASYEVYAASVKGRADGSEAFRTKKHEIECYLHPNAIREAFAVTVDVADKPSSPHDSVGKQFARKYSLMKGFDGVMKEGTAKKILAEEAFPKMTAELIDRRDPDGEVRGWFKKLAEMLNT
jgi:energy-coupling factor transporter ATP-binding protein EcfA2